MGGHPPASLISAFCGLGCRVPGRHLGSCREATPSGTGAGDKGPGLSKATQSRGTQPSQTPP